MPEISPVPPPGKRNAAVRRHIMRKDYQLSPHVMPGLDPGMTKNVDGRVKPGHDGKR
jgi:hypothetical protein